jgi:hypothetical protein
MLPANHPLAATEAIDLVRLIEETYVSVSHKAAPALRTSIDT